MKNTELFKKANDNIEVTEELKRKTKNKVLEKKSKAKFFVAKLANVALIFMLVFSVLWLADENKNKNTPQLPEIIISNKDEKLNKVGSLDKLKELIKQSQNSNRQWNSFGLDSIMESATADTAIKSEAQSTTTTNKTYSDTNVQVENVDESDIVKTDGNFIYYVANNEVYIIEANSLEIKTKLEYENKEFSPSQIFLAKDKLIVIGYKSQYSTLARTYVDSIMPLSSGTMAIVYDITNRSNVIKLREVSIEGNFLSARMVDNNVYLVTNKYVYIPYKTDINDLKEEDLVPYYMDTAISQEKCNVPLNDIYYIPKCEDTNSYLILASFNIDNEKEVELETILGGGNNVYCSEENIYIAKTIYEYNLLEEAKSALGIRNTTVHTEIYKFALNDGNISYEKNGTVPGYIINQFSMDEYDGFFRIATTKQTNWDSDTSTNNLYVLDTNLSTVGSVQNLAKGEKIYSVRFMGKKAYVVTFKQTDPLFVIDLSKPTTPEVLGELKIPGYSQYLHPYDETHLIGFGYNTETVDNGYGEIVRNTGMKIALFDVTDVENPKELHKVDIGTAGTYSEILNNHKALLFSKEKNIIAFPITISEKYNVRFQGAIVYGLDLENGFQERARIPNKDSVTSSNYNYNYQIQRILFIDDNLYTLSRSLIKQIDMNTMQKKAQLEIKVKE